MNTCVESSRFLPAARFTGLLVLLLGVCIDPTVGLAQVERILDPSGREFADLSVLPSISADARYVTFTVASETPPDEDILFLHDRITGATRPVARQHYEDHSYDGFGRLSADGRYLAYGVGNVYVQDLHSGLSKLVSISSGGIPGNGGSYGATISADGRFVAFESEANNLVPGDTNDVGDVFVHDRDTGNTERVSISSAGIQGNDSSRYHSSISADGYSVAFGSQADNLVANDTNDWRDIFVHDRRLRTTERVSVSSSGEQANLLSISGIESISADGQRVVFISDADNLVPNDSTYGTGGDIFVRDRGAQTTRRVNVGPGGTEAQGSSGITLPSISANGRYVAFPSEAGNLVPGDGNREWDLFVHDLETGVTTRVSEGPLRFEDRGGNTTGGFAVSFSADGQTLAFSSYANNLVPGDTNNVQDIFITTLGAPIDQSIYVSLVSVADLNGNGSPELAVARTLTDGRAEVLIRDSATKQALGTVDFIESGLPLVDLAAVGDVSGEGYPELAALFRKPDGPAVVQLKDAAAGSEIGRLRFFGKDWDVTAVTGIDRGSDGPEIAVLGVRKDTLQAGIELRPAADDGTVARMQFPVDAAREYRDLAVLEDSNGDGQPELASLFTLADGTAKVVIKDGVTKDRINTLSFPGTELRAVGASAIGVAGIGDLSGDGSPDVAVLFRKANGQAVVQIRDAGTGRWIHQMQFFGSDWYVVAVTGLDSNGDGVPDLAVLAVRDDGTAAAVQVRDASSGQPLDWMDY